LTVPVSSASVTTCTLTPSCYYTTTCPVCKPVIVTPTPYVTVCPLEVYYEIITCPPVKTVVTPTPVLITVTVATGTTTYYTTPTPTVTYFTPPPASIITVTAPVVAPVTSAAPVVVATTAAPVTPAVVSTVTAKPVFTGEGSSNKVGAAGAFVLAAAAAMLF